MIGEQYKKDQKREKKEARTGLERGKNGMGTGSKMGFKRYKSRNLAKFVNLERGRMAPQPLSTSFQPVFCCSASFFTRFS